MSALQEELEKVFNLFTDETNKMPIRNLDNAIRSAGYVIDNSIRESVTEEHLSFPEFLEFINCAQEHELGKEQIEESFKFFDPEDTGFIKAVDFKQILATGKEPLSDEEISSIFEMFPPNADGLICYSLPINYVFDECRK